MKDEESVVDPAYVLRAARTFLTATQPGQAEEGSSEEGWEAAGCLLWDIAAIPEQAQLLTAHNIMDSLQLLATASIVQERWRALEIALGILANLACHKEVRQALLGSAPLAELVLERALWVDDTPALGEACRLLSALCLSTQRDDRWWALMTAPEGLGRIVWMIENTLSPALLEKALALACAMLQAAGEQLPSLAAALLELDILATAASVLGSFMAQLEQEQQEFDGGGGTGSPAGEKMEAEGGPGEGAGGAAPDGDSGGGLAAAAGGSAGPVAAAAGGGARAGPEVGEAIALEALNLLDNLTASEAGSAAVGAAAGLVDSVLAVLELCESTPLRLVCLTLLASLDGVGPRLAARPEAVGAALGVLAAVEGGAASAVTGAEVAAAWALCSTALHAAAAAAAAGGQAAGPGGKAGAGAAAAMLGVALDYSAVLLGAWEAAGVEIAEQQQYCLRQLQLLLERQGPTEEYAAFAQQVGSWLADKARGGV